MAVVLGADVNGLGHIRSLGQEGIISYVICSGANFENLARFSKYCIPVFISPHLTDYHQKLVECLIQLAEKSPTKMVLFATSDFFVNFIAAQRNTLAVHYYFNIPDTNILKLVLNKYNTHEQACNSDITSPNTLRTHQEPLEDIFPYTSFPCIVKPEDSFSVNFPGKNMVFEKEDELKLFFQKNNELQDHCIIQEIIPGDETSIFQCTCYIGNNVPSQMFTMQKLCQRPPGYGVATIGRSKIIPALFNYTEKLLSDMGYTGFASVEFKKSSNNSKYYLIEINPRLPWYNSLFLSSGVNFPYIQYQDLTGTPDDQTTIVQQEDVYWLHFSHTLSSYFQALDTDMKKSVITLFAAMIKCRSFAYFHHKDLIPFFMSNIELIYSMFTKIFTPKNTK